MTNFNSNFQKSYIRKYTKNYPLFIFPLVEVGLVVECDDWGEPIHYHFDSCPCCGKVFAATDQYCSPNDTLEEGELLCEECGSEFFMMATNGCSSDLIILCDTSTI